VRDGGVISMSIGTQPFAVQAAPDGGTIEVPIPPDRRNPPVLTDVQVVQLVELGRRIEAHFGRAQDIEWCLVDDAFHPHHAEPADHHAAPRPAATDDEYHVYVSVGHGQMMTEAMRRLGISVWQHTALIPMHEAGSRLFIEVTARLASPATRALTLEVFDRGDPLLRDALETVLARNDVLPPPAGETPPLHRPEVRQRSSRRIPRSSPISSRAASPRRRSTLIRIRGGCALRSMPFPARACPRESRHERRSACAAARHGARHEDRTSAAGADPWRIPRLQPERPGPAAAKTGWSGRAGPSPGTGPRWLVRRSAPGPGHAGPGPRRGTRRQ
jgi:hypothetical protein